MIWLILAVAVISFNAGVILMGILVANKQAKPLSDKMDREIRKYISQDKGGWRE